MVMYRESDGVYGESSFAELQEKYPDLKEGANLCLSSGQEKVLEFKVKTINKEKRFIILEVISGHAGNYVEGAVPSVNFDNVDSFIDGLKDSIVGEDLEVEFK